MLAYTICFIKQGERILLLNRNKPALMGVWNGVGGKLEAGETPLASILREVWEETGIPLAHAEAKGTVTWQVDGWKNGGMYLFFAELPEEFRYETPRGTEEGILDWKEIAWILHPENAGVAAHVRHFLPALLNDAVCYEHRCIFENGKLASYQAIPLQVCL